MNPWLNIVVPILLSNPMLAWAELVPVRVDGPAYPIKLYYDQIGLTKGRLNIDVYELSTRHSSFTEIIQFPITTPSLTLGKVKTRHVHIPELTQPLFLLGSDATSLAWLNQYADRLKALHAVGFLIQVNSKQEWQRVQKLARGLSIIPSSGDVFAKRFAVQHYPLLIANNLIEQ